MLQPITPALAQDWIAKLLKHWGVLHRTRAEDLTKIKDLFGDPELLAKDYIEPDCQPVNPADHDEDEPIRAFRKPIRDWLNKFFKGAFRIPPVSG